MRIIALEEHFSTPAFIARSGIRFEQPLLDPICPTPQPMSTAKRRRHADAAATLARFTRFFALETDQPVEPISIDDLPIGRAPWPLLQIVHDPATFAEPGEPCA